MPQVGLPSELSFLIPILNSIFWIERSKQVSTLAIQTNAPWNLVRISEHMLRVPSIYRYLADGRGVDAYIIDSGIQSSNVDFKGHATTIADFTNSGLTDAYGHGTHVAGIVGSQTYGVAKSVNLLGVRVINSSGTSDWATVVAALSWVYNRVKMTKRPSVINMSLGGPISVALNAAISDLEALNVAVVAAAGNSRSDACMYSPSSSTSAIVVAASDYNNAWFAMSNFGSCVDMIAPGSYITSTFIGSNRSVAAMTGTSMAAPHVTGVVALLLSMNPTLTVSQLKLILTITCTNGIVSGIPIGRTPNRFLYSLATF
ncbi:serine peptidase [Mitosporidium daphniae]|uniref:Serine peptidase n=1 Tax=Mitosporidium daphniae TaxID=1485682 RepID=A0A098VPL3_9MICR|nr:serine peptidase [Mitosporidium daphniae]KGG50865.1 serine peptidase [Mitosporidium daphniae]|eukprot:XP_013237292.1 serine peptidase [Mitosporidium daphniae]